MRLGRPRAIRSLALTATLGAALGSLACGDDGAGRKVESGHGPTAGPAVRAEGLLDAPSWPDLIELLGQPHERARELLGPHRLHYAAELRLGPAGLAEDEPLPEVEVDEPIYERFVVHDELELLWAAAPGEPVKLSLTQQNEHQHGRELIVIGDRAWSRLDGREWLLRPLESDLWQLWLDDAVHAPLDLVELAGPFVDISEVRSGEHRTRPAIFVTLAPGEHRPERVVSAPTPWRRGATVELKEGSLILDRATGLWLAATLELDWRVQDSAGRELRGHARLEAQLEPLASPPAIVPPADARPLPERERPELLRERLLDGLAGP